MSEPHRKSHALPLVAMGLFILASRGARSESYWTAETGEWNVNANWSGETIPGADDVVVATNYPGSAGGAYLVRVSDGVVAECAQLKLDTGDVGWPIAPHVTVEGGGKLYIRSSELNSYVNSKSAVHVEDGGEFSAVKLLVGLPSNTAIFGKIGAGAFVNEGKSTVSSLALRRGGVVTNCGEMVVSYLKVGGNVGSGTVVQTGGALEILNECSVAKDGSDEYSAELVVTGGSVTNRGFMRVAYADRNRSNTRVTVTGKGTSWVNLGTGTSNDNGCWFGKYNNSTLYMTNGWFVVADGARFENACAMTFARMAGTSSGQRIDSTIAVTNGAVFFCRSNVLLGELCQDSSDGVSTGRLVVDNAEAFVTNAAGTAELRLGSPLGAGTSEARGRLEVLGGGLVCCDRLVATNGTRSVVNVVSGVVRAKDAKVATGSVLTLGAEGASGGEWRLGAAGVCEFSGGLAVLAGAALGVEFDAEGQTGFADVGDQELSFASGSRLNVTLNGFEPQHGTNWVVARARTISGLPVATKGWSVAKVAEGGRESLMLQCDPPGLKIVVR